MNAELVHDNGVVQLYQADARALPLEDGSVHTVVTSPPYWGLRDYGLKPSVWDGDPEHEHRYDGVQHHEHRAQGSHGKSRTTERFYGGDPSRRFNEDHQRHYTTSSCKCGAWEGSLGLEPTPELYVEHIVEVFREVWRVLRDEGTVWLNLGDSYASTGYKAHATPLDTKGEAPSAWAAENRGFSVQRTAVSGLKPKDLVGMPWRVAFALQADGWYLRCDIIWSKPNPMPESVRDRPTRAHEYLFLLSKSERYYYDIDAIREPLAQSSIQRISQPTFDQQSGGDKDYAKTGVNPSRSARKSLENLAASHKGSPFHTGKTGQTQHRNSDLPRHDHPGGRNRRSVWEIATQPYLEAHFATFPEKLVEPCILAGAPKDGVVLDPFAGSGTVCAVAQRLGRRAVGVDLSAEYLELAIKRLANTNLALPL